MKRSGLKYAIPALLVLLVGTGGASAQDIVFSMQASESCLSELAAEQDAAETCLGNSARACMADTDGGRAADGALACIQAELAGWENRMNGSFVQRQVMDQVADGEGAMPTPLEPLLQAMQGQWLNYRDARCDYIGFKEGGDEAFEERRDWCRLKLTGLQTLLLRGLVRNY